MEKDLTSPEAIAQRLTNLRTAAGLTRKEIEDRHGIRSPSLRSWEMGSRTLKQANAEILSSIFKNYGIICTADWLLKGEGPDPLERAAQSSEEAHILKEIYRFESFYPNSTVLPITDDYMGPWVRKGDHVGGVWQNQPAEETFLDQVCMVKTREFGTQVRLVKKGNDDQLYNLISFSGKGDLLNVALDEVAVVIFLRRRQAG